MQFTTERARELIRAFSLSESTFATWKMRGEIPDKYNKELGPIREHFQKLDIEIMNRLIDRCINKNELTNYLDTTQVPWDITPEETEGRIRSYINYANKKEIRSIGDNKLAIYEKVKRDTGTTDKFFLETFNTKNLNTAISGLIELMRLDVWVEDYFEQCKACGFLNPDDSQVGRLCQKCGHELWPDDEKMQ